eukprot:TRINITY_DN17975_c0_g1_i1.p1 TRINITY_DN17975_c0_g1~~TRINITY_DN17975_c0_g1_i1.p1  ORF type:complete len:123 (+),score=27.65 TRINITY_DN17975_c0_g1_i1:460-828(+)
MGPPLPFPVKSRQFNKDIKGIKTDFLISRYEDYTAVMVTQIGKMGTILQAKKEETYGGASTYTVNTLFGKRDEPLLEACARQLAEKLSAGDSSRPLLLSLGLRDPSSESVREILNAIVGNVL